jgi:hypothetical protein
MSMLGQQAHSLEATDLEYHFCKKFGNPRSTRWGSVNARKKYGRSGAFDRAHVFMSTGVSVLKPARKTSHIPRLGFRHASLVPLFPQAMKT